VRPSRRSVGAVLAVAVLAAGVLALAVAAGQRLGALIILAAAQQQEAAARADLDEAASAAAAAAAEQDAAAVDGQRAQSERARAATALAEEQARIVGADRQGRLGRVEELLGVSSAQVQRFAAMNEAALTAQTALFNDLVRDSNDAITRVNDLWRGLISSGPGVAPSDPAV